MSTCVGLSLRRGHRAPRGGGVKDLTAAVRSALPGCSLTPLPDPGALAYQAEKGRGERSGRWVGRFGEGGVGAGAGLCCAVGEVVALVGAQGGVDGVGQAPAQQSEGFGAGFAAGGEFVEIDRSWSTPRDCLIAIMCSALLRVRLPPLLSRTLPAVLPDQAGMGAVPVNRA